MARRQLVVVGLLALAGACFAQGPIGTPCFGDPTQCLSGFCCTNDNLPQCPATGLCASCFGNVDCGAAWNSQFCDVNASPFPICVNSTKGAGAVCTSSRECIYPLYCGKDGRCANPNSLGSPCPLDIAGDTTTCGKEAYCQVAVGATTGTCVIRKSYGQECSGVTPCQQWLQCDFNQPNFGTCKYWYGPNQPGPLPNVNCNNDDQCSNSEYCATTQVAPGQCVVALAVGNCTRNSMCITGNCLPTGTCVPAQPCNIPGAALCQPGWFCAANNFCTAKFETGAVCSQAPFTVAGAPNNNICQSGFCALNSIKASGPDLDTYYCQGCNPAQPLSCPGSFTRCLNSTGLFVCQPLQPAGQPCLQNGDCLSNNCVSNVCINGCRTTSDCTATYGPTYICDPKDNLCKAPVNPGNPCLSDTDCGLNGVCYNYICRIRCNYPFAAFCPIGTTCQPVSPPGASACLPGVPSVLRPDGAHCTLASECASDICNCGVCGWKCSCDADCSGQPGTRCNLNTGKCEGPPGLLPVGFACLFSEQCESGYCNCGFCKSYCRSNYDCPLGYYCDAISAQCLWNRKPNGIRCLNNDECQSGYCFDCSYCAPGCSFSNPCPCGQYCNAAGQCQIYTPLPCPGCINPFTPYYNNAVQPILNLGAGANAAANDVSGLASGVLVYGTVEDNSKCIRNTDCKSGVCQLRTGYGLCGDCRTWPGICLKGTTCNTRTGFCIADVITPGLVPDGGLCAFDGQCQSAACNYQTCGKCSATKPCLLGATCDANGKCVPLLPTPSANCPDGFSCTNDTQCASKVCNLGICGWCFPAKNGFPGSCPTGYTCGNDGKCVFVKLSNGSPCVNGTQCQSGICTPQKVNGVLQLLCQAKCLINQDCQPGYACNPSTGVCTFWLKPYGGVCNADWECRSNFCHPDNKYCTAKCKENDCFLGTNCNTTSHLCVWQKKDDGGSCVYDDECWAGVCNNGYCGSCKSPVYSGCPEGQTCGSNGRCTKTLKKDGQFCFLGSDCNSGFCIAGQCGLPCGADPARSCPTGYYCKQGSCLPGCYLDQDCPIGNLCYRSVCRPRVGAWDGEVCRIDSECLSTWCYQGFCRSKGQWMERCGADIECQSGFCDVSFTAFGWGVCTLPCSGPNADCPGGYYCASGPQWYSSMCVQQGPGFRPGGIIPYSASIEGAALEALAAAEDELSR